MYQALPLLSGESLGTRLGQNIFVFTTPSTAKGVSLLCFPILLTNSVEKDGKTSHMAEVTVCVYIGFVWSS